MDIIKTNRCIKGIVFPNTLVSIGYTFRDCKYLTSITIPPSVTDIILNAFSGAALADITVDGANANYSSEDGVLFNKAKTTLLQYPRGKSDTTYAIPPGVTTIGNGALSSKALTSVSIPSSVTTIKDRAFLGCTALTTANLSGGIATGKEAFYGCTALTSVTFASGLRGIGEGAFRNCSALASISIPGTVINIETLAFYGCTALTSVTFESGSDISNYLFGDHVFPVGSGPSETGNQLKSRYFAASPKSGTYTRDPGGYYWTKQ
jgi:GH24 family phage-related lysozyme (muramidase)